MASSEISVQNSNRKAGSQKFVEKYSNWNFERIFFLKTPDFSRNNRKISISAIIIPKIVKQLWQVLKFGCRFQTEQQGIKISCKNIQKEIYNEIFDAEPWLIKESKKNTKQ